MARPLPWRLLPLEVADRKVPVLGLRLHQLLRRRQLLRQLPRARPRRQKASGEPRK